MFILFLYYPFNTCMVYGDFVFILDVDTLSYLFFSLLTRLEQYNFVNPPEESVFGIADIFLYCFYVFSSLISALYYFFPLLVGSLICSFSAKLRWKLRSFT